MAPAPDLASRYLDLVKGVVLDEHYLENEVRLEYLVDCIRREREPNPRGLRDPKVWLRHDVARLRRERSTGTVARAAVDRPLYPLTFAGRAILDRVQACVEAAVRGDVEGDLAACGVGRGGVAIFMRACLDAFGSDDRTVWVADSFRGLPEPQDADEPLDPETNPNLVVDLNMVRDGFDRLGLLDDRVRFLQGPFSETLPAAPIESLALLDVGTDGHDATSEALERLHGRVAARGFVLVENYREPRCRAAVDEFRADRGLDAQLEPAGPIGVSWRRDAVAPDPAAADAGPALGHPPLASPAAELDLSVVVVVHNMRREAARTLHSLSRAYQAGIDDLSYEVVVVENGSDDDQALGDGFVRDFGPEFRYLDLGQDATRSPAPALNRGIAVSRGKSVALMIDGAHVLTPGVLRFGLLGLRSYDRAVVTARQWYVGPGQQGDLMEQGYDQGYEDRLFEAIEWPGDGYRLFEIGHFVGERDWFEGLWESNCLFVPRALLAQAGGLDEAFSMPGGGYANLEVFERLGATPGVTVVDILGEGTFHQLHGGTSTNQPDIMKRHSRLMSYRDHYEEIRRRPFRGAGKQRHFVGSMVPAARRTTARRMTAPAFKRARSQRDGAPENPTPIPQDLQDEYLDAYWHSLAWREQKWLGSRLAQPPADLIAYQQLLAEVEPD